MVQQAFVTSIGEPTTETCVWALERQGFKVTLIQDKTSLAEKLKRIYDTAEEDFIRVDADVIVNRNVKNLKFPPEVWWVQGQTFGWYCQDRIYGGVQMISKKALPYLRSRIHEAMQQERPETYMFRLPEFHSPRRCVSQEILCGIHGYGIEDMKSVAKVKVRRGQIDQYDFELAERLNEL